MSSPEPILPTQAQDPAPTPAPPAPAPKPAPVPAPDQVPAPRPAARGWQDDLPVNLRDHEWTSGYENTPDGLAKAMQNHIEDQPRLRRKGVRLPDWQNPDDKGRFYNELGRPESPDGYDLSEVEIPEIARQNMDEASTMKLIKLCHDQGLNQFQMRGVLEGYMGVYGDFMQGAFDTALTRRDEAKASLQKKWGASYEAKIDLANRALWHAAGNSVDQVRDIRLADGSTLGSNPSVIEMFAKVGETMGEGKMLGDKNRAGGGPMPLAPDEAQKAYQAFNRQHGAALVDKSLPYDERQSLLQQKAALARAAWPEREE